MKPPLSEQTLDALRKIDSPTVSNAIEHFKVRPRVSGYAGFDLRCVYPDRSTMLGYAVTCTADSTTEDRSNPSGVFPLWEAMENSPAPTVLVIQDIGNDRLHSCHLGEVMATTARALGAVGCVSDGGLRDIKEIEALGDFQLFCPGFVVSHGNPVICEVNVPVEISGMKIEPGDLLHGDLNGLLKVPVEVAEGVIEETRRVREREAKIMEFVRTPGFSVERFRKFQEDFHH